MLFCQVFAVVISRQEETMSRLVILDAGNADCIVIHADGETGAETVVMDGGMEKYNGRSVLYEYLMQNNIRTIDLLVLTHLHQDHFGGFGALIDNVRVKTAILPYGKIECTQIVNALYPHSRHYARYNRFCEYLTAQGTEIRLADQCAEMAVSFGDTELICLFPHRGANLSLPGLIPLLSDTTLTEESVAEVCATYKAHINPESSVWLLCHRGENIALLPGDSMADVQRSILGRLSHPPAVLKLSHHGVRGGGKGEPVYFDKDLLAAIRPAHMVVTNFEDNDGYAEVRALCEELCHEIGVALHFTCEGVFEFVY